MESKNSKETINLLNLLSNSDSELSDLQLAPPKKRRCKRRPRTKIRGENNHSCACNKGKTRIISLWIAAVLITIWLVSLSWLAAVLHGEIGRMDISIKSEKEQVGKTRMDSVAVTVPLRPPTKKMKKRKELDALAPSHIVSRRTSGKRSSQELLTDSSDERSEYWNVQMRGNRKIRSRRHRPCPGLLRACSVFFGCATILATASLIWLFIDVRQQLTSLRTEVDQVIAGSESLPEALQKCHSDFKKLEKNQTSLSVHLGEIDKQIVNFSLKLSQMQDGFSKMQSKLKNAPELTIIPTQLHNLGSSVANLGSDMRDIHNTVDNLKGASNKIQEIQEILIKNITDIQNTLASLSNITQRPEITTNETKIKTEELSQSVAQLRRDLIAINETLTRNLTWVQSDQQKDHNLLNSLQDKTQNAITKVMSLEGDCAKATEQSKIVESVKKLTDDLTGVQASSTEIKTKIAQLEESYSQINNSTNVILNTIASMKTNSPTARSQPDDSTQT